MSRSVSKDLDLAGTIRPGLDILANEIVIALKKRTRFLVNAPVYRPGLVRDEENLSLLDYTLGSVEHLHAQLGRYTFATQEAFTDIADVAPAILRKPPESPLLPSPSGVGQRLKDFYQSWILQACAAGDDAATYGETVTADVGALLSIMERVNLGKPVAESKFREYEQELRATGGDRAGMLEYIVRPEREAAVLAMAERLADRYELSAVPVRGVFEFMIATTVDIEIDYLRRRIG